MAGKRRSSADIRRELIAAASHLFATRGWAGTSTKEIASRAGTYETSLYTHFGSKAGIFIAAVVEPFQMFIDSFRATLAADHTAPEETLARRFVHDLYRTLEENREAVTAFVLAMQDPAAERGARRRPGVAAKGFRRPVRQRTCPRGGAGRRVTGPASCAAGDDRNRSRRFGFRPVVARGRRRPAGVCRRGRGRDRRPVSARDHPPQGLIGHG